VNRLKRPVLSIRHLLWQANCPGDTDIPVPISGAFRRNTIGTPGPDHDVSGTNWRTRGRVTLSITTMMPVRQWGHSHKDRPVSASKRSR